MEYLTCKLSTDNNDNSIVILGADMDAGKAYDITWLIRRLFRAMRANADVYLSASGLVAADRAVMEFLYPDLRLSVPEIARRYQVSRQHVQVTVNRLLERGLLSSENNPKHKRSSLIRLSKQGQSCFDDIRRAESALLLDWFGSFSDSDLIVTQRTLHKLLENIDRESDRCKLLKESALEFLHTGHRESP